MLITVVHDDDGEWEVWAHLEDGDPRDEGNSLCVGAGKTHAEAVADAVLELEQAAAILRALPPGEHPEDELSPSQVVDLFSREIG